MSLRFARSALAAAVVWLAGCALGTESGNPGSGQAAAPRGGQQAMSTGGAGGTGGSAVSGAVDAGAGDAGLDDDDAGADQDAGSDELPR